ncbi:hypothetical protein ECE50_006670 [Chitinophaga sp. Mgbs1]|uniref:Uncharacterized protein n=1 Tax=Chitinophaga solisilvae TaxID=1233460 RepID=A0A433WPB5_9BACT|nr:hypothetical protein [Chitinophaga solisilvae]
MLSRFNARYVFTFLLLTLLFVELHELVHAWLNHILCGCDAARVFDNVPECGDCNAAASRWVDIGGPLFSFAAMWGGMLLLRVPQPRIKALGFALIFANLPFGRLIPLPFTLLTPSTSDEMTFIRKLTGAEVSLYIRAAICIIVVLALTIPPLRAAWYAIREDVRRRVFWRLYFLPLPFILIYLIAGWNNVLRSLSGTPWSKPVILGTPLLIVVHTAVVLLLLVLTFRHLYIPAEE